MPFEDELGEALRNAGAGFTPDPNALVEAGERRGRRLVARRRAAVAGGSVLALAFVGSVGAWSGGLFGLGDGPADVAAAPPLPRQKTPAPDPGGRAGTGAVTGAQLIDVLKSLTPGRQLTDTQGRGSEDSGMLASGILDDGKGRASMGVSLTRIDPVGGMAREMTTCPDRKNVTFDSCTDETLPDGSRLLLIQAWDYDDSRRSVKNWRATLVTPQGFLIDANENNAPQGKQAKPTRTDPPLSMAELKAVVLSDKWHPALNDLPPAPAEHVPGKKGELDAENFLEHLLRAYEFPVADRGGDGGYGYVVLDDGKGRSMIELRIQQEADSKDFASGATTQPLGVKMKVSQGPAQNAAAGTVKWTVDTLRSNGYRVTVTAYNSPKQAGPASRTAPVLTLEQLKEVALSRHWQEELGR
ncbi:hypothetical protein OOK31_18740 [Streptomyces sp. NBC_00249]|uniref:hypothetical protein n=1 Tax=Streptomyces sp. NBC_00249 TaxID=2975690 RepID=UPI0022510C6D|nr:hypothetical protein [Streptomyces sp. NBC_00249]MCX5195904.1 hypothetical protein [Streptomyces sp. NBC_00249]